MQCWSWFDVILYFVTATILLFWHLKPVEIFLVLIRFPLFVFIELPLGVLREFKITSFERRRADRPYGSFFEYAAIRYITWVLSTFRAVTCGPIFFGEVPARFLYFFRRCKYGTENIGDFEPTRVTISNDFNGYWVRSRSRANKEPDLVIYFVPGNIAGTASAYLYIEYLSMLLVELQVQGFANPVALVADIHLYSPGGYVSAFKQTRQGWAYVLDTHPGAVTLAKGSGIGGTLLLTLLLDLARPFHSLAVTAPGVQPSTEPHPTACSTGLSGLTDNDLESGDDDREIFGENEKAEGSNLEFESFKSGPPQTTSLTDLTVACSPMRKPDAMLLLSPFPVVWCDRLGNFEDLLGAHIMRELREQLLDPEQAYETWARPGNVRASGWWRAALPDQGTVIMYGSAELMSHDIEQLVQNLKSSGRRVHGSVAGDQLHAWPILLSFISRTVTDQMSGIDEVADHIAKMLVMECIG